MKRGQLTTIVIIGLFVLVIGAVIFLLKRPDTEPQSLIAKEEAAKVTEMVQGCLAQAGEETLRELGRHGGYLTTAQFRDTPDPRSSQVITMEPQKIVLWHELHPCGDDTRGCYGNNRPPLCRDDARSCPLEVTNTNEELPSIQEQLETGTAVELLTCLDFRSIQSIVTPQGEPVVESVIRDQDILLRLDYPLQVQTTDNEDVRISEYSATLDINLPRIYAFATKIQEAQADYQFIEEAFLHLLAIYSGVDTPIPPFRETRMTGAPTTWVRSQVEQEIEDGILPFMNFLQIMNAWGSYGAILPEDVNSTYAPYAIGAYQYLSVRIDNSSSPLGARFEYPNTGMYLDINGKQLLRPKRLLGGGFLAEMSGMAFTEYKFKYTTAFPMVLHITDDEAFHGKGYQFDLGLEANVWKNNPVNLSIDFIQLQGSRATLDLLAPEQLVDHTFEITVRNRRTYQPVPNTLISMECGTSYPLGVTDAQGVWRGKMPYCLGDGSVLVEHLSYLSDGKVITNTEDDGVVERITFDIWPRQQKRVIAYKRSPADIAALMFAMDFASLRDYKTNLSVNDSVYIQIARRPESSYQDDVPLAGGLQFGKGGGNIDAATARQHVESVFAAGHLSATDRDMIIDALNTAARNNPDTLFLQQQLADFVPGTYDFEGMLIHTGLVQIPQEERCEDTLGGLDEECFTLEARNFTGWLTGGMFRKGPDAITLTPEFIYSDQPLTLFVLEQPIPMNWAGVEAHQDIEAYQSYGRQQMVIPICGDRLC